MMILKVFGAMILIGFIFAAYRDLRQSYKEVTRREEEAERERRAHELELQREQELQEAVRYYLQSGKKIDAIKECKDFYNCSLSKAKTIVSEIEFEMAYEREHNADHRPYAQGQTFRDDSALQDLNNTSYSFAIDGMEGHQFEFFCADLLLKNGFEKADVTPGSGDQGVDIIAIKDSVKYAIQCKNYKTALGNTPVQEVNAGKTFYKCHVGVVMTNSTFTPGAQKLADATGILLWDRAYIEKLLEKAGIHNTPLQREPQNEKTQNTSEEYRDHQQKPIPPQDTDGNTGDMISKDLYSSASCDAVSQQEQENDDSVVLDLVPCKMRKGMKALMIFCLFYIAVSVLAGISTKQLDMAIGMSGFFGILAGMFFVLARSSKHIPYVLIGKRMIKKRKFVLVSIVTAFIFFEIVLIVNMIVTG